MSLQLVAKLGTWRIFAGRREDPSFQPLAKKILERDHYTCQYCGFQAKEYQDIINIDGDYRNHKPNNLVTACCFCSQCFFLESVGVDESGGGTLIYLPELSQAHLNSFCHVLFCAMGNGTEYEDTAQTIYRSLKFRSQIIENQFGAGTANPAAFGQLLLEYEYYYPDRKLNLLDHLRLLPSYSKFSVQLGAWAKAAAQEISA